jgi:hypothetical protein
MMAWATPNLGIFDFERWFVNTTIPLTVNLFTSSNVSFLVWVTGTARPWIYCADEIYVNQSAELSLTINIRSSISWVNVQAQITFINNRYHTIHSRVNFDATSPVFDRKIAFDFTHTPWWMDSIFGQFREFYSRVTDQGVAIEEIRDRREITIEKLREFDAVIILDPCAWEFGEVGNRSIPISSIEYTKKELDIYRTYWVTGGSIMITGGTNCSIDLAGVNQLLELFNMSMNFDAVPLETIVINGVANAIQVVNINRDHPVTRNIVSFDYNGASLNVTDNHTILAREIITWLNEDGVRRTALKPVLAVDEGGGNGRLIVTGSNFFIDNWGLLKKYGAEDDSGLMLRCIYWLVHMPGF